MADNTGEDSCPGGGQSSFSSYEEQDEHKPRCVCKVGGGSTGRYFYNTASNFSVEYRVDQLMNYLRELVLSKVGRDYTSQKFNLISINISIAIASYNLGITVICRKNNCLLF